MRGQFDLFGGLPFGDVMVACAKPAPQYTPETPIAPAGRARRGTYCRANNAIKMILSGKRLGSRAFDNCLEMGDGEDVSRLLVGRMRKDHDFSRAVLRNERYMCPTWIVAARSMIEREEKHDL